MKNAIRAATFGLLLLAPRPSLAQLDAPPEAPDLPSAPPREPPPAPPPRTPPDLRVPPDSPSAAQPPAGDSPGADSSAALPSSGYQSLIKGHRPSPAWTQDRSFTSTRLWLLDPGNYEVQTWLRTRIFHPDSQTGIRPPAEMLLQVEAEIGLVPHLQIDIYENLNINVDENGNRALSQEGVQLEARIAIPSYYGQMFGNPVVYLEWHPRQGNPDRAELRLLLGGAPTKWLVLAMNPYVESNVEQTDCYALAGGGINCGRPLMTGDLVTGKSKRFIADMEFGTTLAAGFRITDWLRASAEIKIGADMLGDLDNKLHFVWFLGPGFIIKPLKNQHLKIMGTCLFAMPGTNNSAQQFEPLLIIGSQF